MADGGFIVLAGVGNKVEGLQWQAGDVLRIGRQRHLEVVLQDTSIDRDHAEIKFHGQRWTVRDQANSPFYPTLLNGKSISGSQEQLRLNDLIQVGQLRLRVAALGAERVADPNDTPVPRPTPVHVTISSAAVIPEKPAPAKKPVDPPRTVEPAPPMAPGVTRPGVLVMTGVHRRPGALASTAESGTESCKPDPLDLQVLQVQASTQQSWDQSLENATRSLSSRPDHGQAMLTLLRTNHHLSNLSNLDELLQNILADVLKSLDAQRAAILLHNPATDQLELRALSCRTAAAKTKKGYSRTLSERCFRQGESLLCQDVKSDQDVHAARSVLFGSMTSIVCALLRTPRKKLGVLHVDRGPMQDPFSSSDLYLADAVAANVAVGIECAQLVEGQSEQFLQTVTTLARAVEMRDQYTGDHTKRVTEFALLLGDEIKITEAEKYQLRVGAPLHDIGKIGIDDAVLRKPGKLTATEFEHMKSHTIKGAQMLDGFHNLASLVPIIKHHHERWDGTGYPDKIGRDDITRTARIVAVADAFDAMTSHRPYRPAMPPQLAYLELLSKAGTHFDPQLVHHFVRLRPKIEEVMRTQPQA